MYSLDWCKYVNHSSLGLRTTGTFQAYTVEISHGGLDVRAMLTAYELALLHAVAREWFTRAVEILDGGHLLGPSTYAMARGLAVNEGLASKRRRIFSSDLFLAAQMGWRVESCDSGTGSVFD